MSKLRLCIDIDNVLCDTDSVIRDIIREYTGGEVDLGYADIIKFNYHECTDHRGNGITEKQWREIHDKYSFSENIHRVQPQDEIPDALHTLREAFEIHIATSRLQAAHEATRDWLASHRIPFDDLHFVNHREKHLIPISFHAAIEDDLEQAKLFLPVASESILLAHPWNKLHQKSDIKRFRDWHAIVRYLMP